MISVILCVYKPRNTLTECVKHLLNNSFQDYEIIIVEQCSEDQDSIDVNTFRSNKIQYFRTNAVGLSKARNYGISKAKGDIVAFTDDDCYVDREWMKNINKAFSNYSRVDAVFGQTISFGREIKDKQYCPCTLVKTKAAIISKPSKHWSNIGFGNNMAFRKRLFVKIGLFKEWLGNGSIGESAEDAEICLRMLISGYSILSTHKVLVSHDRMLFVGSDDYYQQMRLYSCGELASYGYYAIKGNPLARTVVSEHLSNRCKYLIYTAKRLIFRFSLSRIFNFIRDFQEDLKGLMVAIWFSLTEIITDTDVKLHYKTSTGQGS